ncbi:hypothetical protein RHGRI_028988 [Rhododendron griersonianum]|uniref:Uncharacterized protein n=1 Tax=Rhododendron griersonianum TaxID=479676 RepID=A0AAV6IIM9_9ERIC|nr:hypothetical protein RHGRI_028988 [Rhododendron griersonianum]
MVVHVPFVLWVCVKNEFLISSRAALYCLETAGGEKVICGLAIRGERNRMTYKPSDYFIEEYCEIFPLGVVAEWNFSCQLGVWLDSIVYHSFVRYNQEVNGASTWIVLRHGFKAWPVGVNHELAKAGILFVDKEGMGWLRYINCMSLLTISTAFFVLLLSNVVVTS